LFSPDTVCLLEKNQHSATQLSAFTKITTVSSLQSSLGEGQRKEFNANGTRTIRVNDVVECLTADGWECGTVTAISEDTITVFMDYLYENHEDKYFLLDLNFSMNFPVICTPTGKPKLFCMLLLTSAP
jgi:hypothetical protein